MAISTVPGVERRGIPRKGKPRLRKRSILRCGTRSVGYLLSIDLMMLEKHLTLLLNWGCKSSAHGVFVPSLFFATPTVKKKLKISTNKQKNELAGQQKLINLPYNVEGMRTNSSCLILLGVVRDPGLGNDRTRWLMRTTSIQVTSYSNPRTSTSHLWNPNKQTKTWCTSGCKFSQIRPPC